MISSAGYTSADVDAVRADERQKAEAEIRSRVEGEIAKWLRDNRVWCRKPNSEYLPIMLGASLADAIERGEYREGRG